MTIAIAAMGLETNFQKMMQAGLKPLYLAAFFMGIYFNCKFCPNCVFLSMISEMPTQKTELEIQDPDQKLEDRATSIHFARPVGHRGGSLLCKGLFLLQQRPAGAD
jgi:hypothetical protein